MMNPFQAVGSAFMNAFSFGGRAPRSEYWWWFLFMCIIFAGALAYDGFTLMNAGQTEFSTNTLPMAIIWTTVVCFFPSLSLAIRRLHDAGFSGFWYLLSFVPFGSFALLIMAVIPSEKRPNRWGPPYGAARLPGADIFNDKPVDDVPEIYQPGGIYGPKTGEVMMTPEDQMAARKAEISDYYKSRVLKQPAA